MKRQKEDKLVLTPEKSPMYHYSRHNALVQKHFPSSDLVSGAKLIYYFLSQFNLPIKYKFLPSRYFCYQLNTK